MKRLLFILTFFLMSGVFADEVKIELNPSKPVAGEVFQAIFRIFSNSSEEPVINFSPLRVEVVGKNNYGIKTSTTWINGKITTSREITIVYELAANQDGIGGLRDITVQLGQKTIRHPSLTFNVLKEPEVMPDVFVMVDVPKKTAFLGEGIVVRYYLYSKVPVSNLDIKKYPKLNNFLKRFLQEAERSERVSVDGQPFLRTQIYGAKLFPEKAGELKIDPLHLTATVLSSRGNDPFGNFGMSRESKTKTISSETVKLEVRPLPEEGKTGFFTGLVGKHEFDLQVNSSKLIVNEPLEVKLTVTGGGALENMDAPNILKHPDLEEFESNGDLKIQDANQATKVFEYTFLPKANLTLPASVLTLTYFDPDLLKYVPVNLKLPEFVVAGGGSKDKKERKKEVPDTQVNQKQPLDLKVPGLAAPAWENIPPWKNFLNYINFILAGAAILISLGILLKKEKWPKFSNSMVPTQFKRGEFQLGEFTRWMTPVIAKTGKSPLNLIKESDLSQNAKTYFIDLLSQNDYKDYSHSKGQMKFVYKAEFFKELDQYIQRSMNEDNSKST